MEGCRRSEVQTQPVRRRRFMHLLHSAAHVLASDATANPVPRTVASCRPKVVVLVRRRGMTTAAPRATHRFLIAPLIAFSALGSAIKRVFVPFFAAQERASLSQNIRQMRHLPPMHAHAPHVFVSPWERRLQSIVYSLQNGSCAGGGTVYPRVARSVPF